MSKRAARFSPVLLFILAASFAVIAIIISRGTTPPDVAANRFFYAMATRNVDDLMKYGYYPDADEAFIRRQWEYALTIAGRHYLFSWDMRGTVSETEDHAIVRVDFLRQWAEPGDVSLVKVDGQWKVDVFSISRDLYPALPKRDPASALHMNTFVSIN